MDKDDFYDELIGAIDVVEEKHTWSFLWEKARHDLFSSMAEEHIKLILEEERKLKDRIIKFRRGECHHFYLIYAQIIFFHSHSELHKQEKKCPLFLPFDIAQRYIDNRKSDADLLSGICRECGYLTFGLHFEKCPYCENRKAEFRSVPASI